MGAKFDTYKWQQEFAAEAQRMTISVNDISNDLEGLVYNIKISMKRSDPIRKLKEQIGKRFNLEMNEFYLVRHSNDKELREMSQSLIGAGLSSHSSVKIVLGKPALEGAYKIKVSIVRLTDDCTDQGNKLFTIETLGDMTLKPEETGLEFKERVLALYNGMQDDPAKQIGIDDFRLRAP